MKYPLKKTDASIAKVIQKGFRKDVSGIEFIPEGEAGWLYRCRDKEGQCLIIKIQRKPNKAGSRVYQELFRNGYSYLPTPILSTHGKIWRRHWFYHYSLQEYVDILPWSGGFRVDDEYLPELGKILRTLHDTTLPKKVLGMLPKETYIPRHWKKVKNLVKRSKKAKLTEYPAVDEVLVKYRDTIDALLKRAVDYSKRLQEEDLPLVPVHGDVHPNNLFHTRDAKLYLADWEVVSLSHAEEDLMYFDDRQLEMISQGYGKDLLQNSIALEYYRHHLRLREIFVFGEKVGMKSKKREERERGVASLRDVCEQIEAQYGVERNV